MSLLSYRVESCLSSWSLRLRLNVESKTAVDWFSQRRLGIVLLGEDISCRKLL